MWQYSTDQLRCAVANSRNRNWDHLEFHDAIDNDLQLLATEPGVETLRKLFLGSSSITDHGLLHLVGLKSLRELALDGTGVTDSGLFHLKPLTLLESLYLDRTPITGIGFRFLPLSLKHLSLAESLVTDEGMPYLSQLPALESLDLARTNICGDGLKHLGGLKNLFELILSRCELLTDIWGLQRLLPPFGKLVFINVNRCNNLNLPDALLRGIGASELFDELEQLRGSKTRALLQIKIVLIGESRTGKSGLAARLISDGNRVGNGEITHDFEVYKLPVSLNLDEGTRTVTYRIYDFGGQPELHSTHRFFLQSRRVIYVLLLNSTLDFDHPRNRGSYWMRLIKSQGIDSPVIVVTTHGDLHCTRRLEVPEITAAASQIDVQLKGIVINYSNRLRSELTQLSITDKFEEVEAVLQRTVSSMNFLFLPAYTEGFFRLLDFVEGHAAQEDFPNVVVPSFNYKMFAKSEYDLAAEVLGKRDSTTSRLKELWFTELRDLGCFHYVGDSSDIQRERNPHSVGSFCYNPSWVKCPVYLIIRGIPVRPDVPKGLVDEKDIRSFLISQHAHATHDLSRQNELWGRLPLNQPEDLDRIIELMLACGTLFHTSAHNEHAVFIVPDWLPVKRAHFAPDAPLKLQISIQYPFLPESTLLRFIGRCYAHSDSENLWRNEVSIESRGVKAVLRAEVASSTLRIAISDQTDSCSDVLWQILEKLHVIQPNPQINRFLEVINSGGIEQLKETSESNISEPPNDDSSLSVRENYQISKDFPSVSLLGSTSRHGVRSSLFRSADASDELASKQRWNKTSLSFRKSCTEIMQVIAQNEAKITFTTLPAALKKGGFRVLSASRLYERTRFLHVFMNFIAKDAEGGFTLLKRGDEYLSQYLATRDSHWR